MTYINNMQAFNSLIGYCTGYGGKYNPGRPNLRIESLQAQMDAVRQALENVKETRVHFINEVNERRQVFARLPALASSVLRTMVACGVADDKLTSARMLVTNLLGKSPRSRTVVAEQGAQPVQPTVRQSSMQWSYWSQADSFSQLVKMIATEPLYQPNEQELSLAGLKLKLASLEDMNQRVAQARTNWSNARLQRDASMYGQEQSLSSLTRAVKSYLRAIFGLHSPQYDQVKGIVIH